jgi:beta-phosphoglucomutase-like phosphatase (HAD superfamily)
LTVAHNWRWRAAETAGRCVVFDLDGVLSDAAGRQHFLDNPKTRDWKAFFDACRDDPLVAEMHRLLELLDENLIVVLLTARPLRTRSETMAWLERYDVRWDLLVMRADADHRPSDQFKQHAIGELRAVDLDIVLAFEDDRRNVAMLRGLGVPCVYIHSGYYE